MLRNIVNMQAIITTPALHLTLIYVVRLKNDKKLILINYPYF